MDIYKVKLVKESSLRYGSVSCVADIVRVLNSLGAHEEPEEHFYVICMNSKGDIVGLHDVAHGDLNTCPVHPREVFKRALLNNAASIIVAHNHPSGNPEPSMEDRILTKRLHSAGVILGVKLLDHVIIGGDEHYSFVGMGEMDD